MKTLIILYIIKGLKQLKGADIIKLHELQFHHQYENNTLPYCFSKVKATLQSMNSVTYFK